MFIQEKTKQFTLHKNHIKNNDEFDHLITVISTNLGNLVNSYSLITIIIYRYTNKKMSAHDNSSSFGYYNNKGIPVRILDK